MEKAKTVLILFLSTAFLAMLFSCKSLSVPDITTFFSNAEKLKTAYCSEPLAEVRKVILDKIHATHPDYPEHGFCGFVLPEIVIQDAPKPVPESLNQGDEPPIIKLPDASENITKPAEII